MKKWLPWILVAIFASWFLGGAEAPKPKDGFDIAAFGRLPVLLDGRVQPFDSVARNSLLSISGRSVVYLTNGPPLSALEWLLDTMARPDVADQLKVFRTQDPDLDGLLGADQAGLQYFSFNGLTNQIDQLQAQAQKVMDAEQNQGEDAAKLRSPLQKDLMHLYNSMVLYNRLKNSLEPEGARDFRQELQVYQEAIAPGRAALEQSEQGKQANEQDLQRIATFFKRYDEVARFAYPLIIPPLPGQSRDAWSNIGTNLMLALRTGDLNPAATNYAAIASAYRNDKPAEFNRAVTQYRVWMEENDLYPALKKGTQEFFFNQIEPFYKSMVIYVAVMLLGFVVWINLSEPIRRAGFALLILAFIIHSIGLGFRMYLEGRPPVTNLYSSAIFIGWGACLLGIILERIFKGGIGLVVSGFIGFTTLIIAHHLALSGDTMEMLRAVLDTNLWLATHVVIVTTGYASMFVAGFLAIIYIVRGFFTRTLTPETARALGRMVYGIVCFATLFSFVGTILGGIWADQSWGRFWGWDPKENGALLIVLWNAVILHARWGGMIKERGLMAMAVFGNIVTSFSWFGVNMLGIGLHSYGFMDKAFPWLVGFDVSQLALIALALSPLQYWASFKGTAPPAPAATRLPTPSTATG
ncbi:MAG TPA: cytochrome c biogenesis protein CcsA [Candidatus Baltobacteraceae bacterium]|jgi:ABC-type transport system involved in cytochrome c biogenesis permease subunit|nr:cytochrome c biogenesis protein CcsA [Candidatus Baltobacteraceae bacterium]